MLSFSCISTKPANSIDKAEKKIALYNEGIKNQIERYPTLIDGVYTETKYETLYLESDSVKLNILYQNISFLDSINKEYKERYNDQSQYIDSLENIDYNKYDTTGVLKKTINGLTLKIRTLIQENNILFQKYNEEISKKIVGEYSDSTFVVNYLFEKGLLHLNVQTKPEYKVVPVSYTTNKIKSTVKFWQDFRFYGFLILLFNLIFFFGAELQAILKKVISTIITFIRKLIFKI
jgi:hypothetical protein